VDELALGKSCKRRSLVAQTSWVGEAPAVNHNVSFEIEDGASEKVALDSEELFGRGLPRIVGNSDGLRRVLGMVRVAAPTDATASDLKGPQNHLLD
jgi:hypothetical protein